MYSWTKVPRGEIMPKVIHLLSGWLRTQIQAYLTPENSKFTFVEGATVWYRWHQISWSSKWPGRLKKKFSRPHSCITEKTLQKKNKWIHKGLGTWLFNNSDDCSDQERLGHNWHVTKPKAEGGFVSQIKMSGHESKLQCFTQIFKIFM